MFGSMSGYLAITVHRDMVRSAWQGRHLLPGAAIEGGVGPAVVVGGDRQLAVVAAQGGEGVVICHMHIQRRVQVHGLVHRLHASILSPFRSCGSCSGQMSCWWLLLSLKRACQTGVAQPGALRGNPMVSFIKLCSA